jgi:hypothetical protein
VSSPISTVFLEFLPPVVAEDRLETTFSEKPCRECKCAQTLTDIRREGARFPVSLVDECFDELDRDGPHLLLRRGGLSATTAGNQNCGKRELEAADAEVRRAPPPAPLSALIT